MEQMALEIKRFNEKKHLMPTNFQNKVDTYKSKVIKLRERFTVCDAIHIFPIEAQVCY